MSLSNILIESFSPESNHFDDYLYHGTISKHLPEILKNGFVEKSFFGSQRIAEYYAEVTADELGGEPIVIAVPLSNFDPNSIEIDWNSYEEPITYALGMKEDELEELWEESDQTVSDFFDIYESVIYTKNLKLNKNIEVIQI